MLIMQPLSELIEKLAVGIQLRIPTSTLRQAVEGEFVEGRLIHYSPDYSNNEAEVVIYTNKKEMALLLDENTYLSIQN